VVVVISCGYILICLQYQLQEQYTQLIIVVVVIIIISCIIYKY
jgi:hypothetical protein